jgi:diacylglycerol kinase family enzyme
MTSSLRVVLLHNPAAGTDGSSTAELVRLIEAAGHDVVRESVDESEWEQVVAVAADVVCAAGGDGTVGKVLRVMAGRSCPVGVLPTGSANNVARALGIAGRSPEELVAGWARGERRRLALGEVAWPERRGIFVETVGGGLFADLLGGANGAESPLGKVELGLQVLRDLVEWLPAKTWRISADGEDLSGDYLGVEAMLIGETGPNVPLAPVADPADSRLELVLITEADRQRLASHIDRRLSGGPSIELGLDVVRCRDVALEADAGTPLRVDDELVSGPAFRASLRPDSVKVVLPER